VQQALAAFDAARQDLMLRLSRAYFDEIVAERHVTAARAQLVSLNEQLEAARHSFDAGVASITDVDDTRSRAASARAQEVGAMNDLESSRAALEAIIGQPPGRLSPLRKATVLPKPLPSDVTDWVQRATEDNPDVKAARAVARAADYELDRSRAQRLPSVDLVATYGGNYAGGNITDPINYDSNVRDKQISLQVTLPLLDGGGMHAQVAEARAQRGRAQSDITTAQRKAALDARQSYAAALSGASQVEALETAVSAGQSAVKGNRAGYGLGIRINSDVLNAEQQLYSTMQDLDKARYDTLFAGLKLKAAAGQLSVGDLQGINELLDTEAPLP
jgi:outer membrane protein